MKWTLFWFPSISSKQSYLFLFFVVFMLCVLRKNERWWIHLLSFSSVLPSFFLSFSPSSLPFICLLFLPSFFPSLCPSFRSKLRKKTSSFSLLSPDGWSFRGVRARLIIHCIITTLLRHNTQSDSILDDKWWERSEEPPLHTSECIMAPISHIKGEMRA